MNATIALERIRSNAERMAGDFVIDKENEQAMEQLAAWLAREPHPEMDANKGLLLVGNVGTGKTLLMRALRAAMSEVWGVQFGIKPCSELVREYGDLGYEGVEKWIDGKHVCFDDLGTENREAIHYGKRTNLMAEVIESRYTRLTANSRCWTHFTTNLGAKDIKDLYGERVYSRILHICNVIKIGVSEAAVDRRKSAPAPKSPDPVNADNIYSLIHPDVAAKMGEVVAPLVAKLKAERPVETKVAHSAEAAREHFAEAVQHMTPDELEARRTDYKKDYPMNTNGHSEAMKYVGIIDAELKRRESVNTEQ
jgi:DNA replication protein DnaC